MAKSSGWIFVLGGAAFVVAALSSPSLAQSDGTLEEAHAAQCARNQDTQFCRTLVEAMKQSAGTADPKQAGAADELISRWGLLAQFVGKTYYSTTSGTSSLTTYRWQDPGKKMILHIRPYGRAGTRGVDDLEMDYEWDEANNQILMSGYYNGVVQPDGSLMETSPDPKQANSRGWARANGKGSWVATSEKLKGGSWRPQFESTYYYEYTPEFAARLRQQATNKGSDSGLLGALAMGAGAAIAGGNSEMVMGAAMKGAEMTTDNEMSRNVLSGQGDQMIADGVERERQRIALEDARQRARSGPASGATAARPPASNAAASGPATGTARPQLAGTSMYGWCYAQAAHGNSNLVYSSQIGHTDRYSTNGVTTDFPNDLWQSRMKKEFFAQLPSDMDGGCYTDPTGKFAYMRDNIYSGVNRISEVQWAPH